MKLEIVEKAYRIDLERVEDSYVWSEKVVHAETVNAAKRKLLELVRYEDMKTRDGVEVCYLNIPVVRDNGADLVIFEGEKVARWLALDRISRKERAMEISELCLTHRFFYILKRGCFFRPNNCGYTDHKEFAGVYTADEARRHALSCEEITLVPIVIEEHNELLNKMIEGLKGRVIELDNNE
ncbi:hypothetical protein [Lacihabitans soyangensis]|uniref:Uncharacterized protein n=1 Tax=Lacihabitans soyangensis TaxID=869394 RepID=A0AAE3H2E5_9BACT|nr:hypothetical protein [Lacihabitans soyangensis]MCP9763819.1 hypothetical protein [Lacihabitans soyangensis]